MGVFGIVVCCVLSALAGMCVTIIVGVVTELYHMKKYIEDLQDKLEQNSRE